MNKFVTLFGILNCENFVLLNHVILIGKQVIYRCKNKLIKPETVLQIDKFYTVVKRILELT